jgi:hypothetical protein
MPGISLFSYSCLCLVIATLYFLNYSCAAISVSNRAPFLYLFAPTSYLYVRAQSFVFCIV